jgi:hypothetical protein
MANRRAFCLFVRNCGDGLMSPLYADAPVRFLFVKRPNGSEGRDDANNHEALHRFGVRLPNVLRPFSDADKVA